MNLARIYCLGGYSPLFEINLAFLLNFIHASSFTHIETRTWANFSIRPLHNTSKIVQQSLCDCLFSLNRQHAIYHYRQVLLLFMYVPLFNAKIKQLHFKHGCFILAYLTEQNKTPIHKTPGFNDALNLTTQV